jgi:hypothetical protein
MQLVSLLVGAKNLHWVAGICRKNRGSTSLGWIFSSSLDLKLLYLLMLKTLWSERLEAKNTNSYDLAELRAVQTHCSSVDSLMTMIS